MSKPKFTLPSPDEMHPQAYSSAIAVLFDGILRCYFHIYLRREDYTIEWNSVWGFWDIRIFKDYRMMEGLGSEEYRQSHWQHIVDTVPAAFGSEHCVESRWARDSEGNRIQDRGQEWGIRFSVYPQKSD